MLDRIIGKLVFSIGNAKSKALRKGFDGENKCNQCDYTSSHPATLKRHVAKHSGTKPKKCIIICIAHHLRTFLKNTAEKNQLSATGATLHPLLQVI